eukprot:COSAG06_NODE_66766_length_253_cov_1.136364_1_plen_58_part_10
MVFGAQRRENRSFLIYYLIGLLAQLVLHGHRPAEEAAACICAKHAAEGPGKNNTEQIA